MEVTVPTPNDPLAVARDAIQATTRQMTPEQVIDQVIRMIEEDPSLPTILDGIRAFDAAIAALVSAYPNAGYEAWLAPEPDHITGKIYREAIDRMARWWSDQVPDRS